MTCTAEFFLNMIFPFLKPPIFPRSPGIFVRQESRISKRFRSISADTYRRAIGLPAYYLLFFGLEKDFLHLFTNGFFNGFLYCFFDFIGVENFSYGFDDNILDDL